MIVARASTEAPGQGIIGAVATKVQQAVPGSDSEAVDYPATLTNYTASEASGVADMTTLIQSYVARCPSSKIALLGYSQGAQVAGDVMCGTSEKGFNGTQPLSAALSRNSPFPPDLLLVNFTYIPSYSCCNSADGRPNPRRWLTARRRDIHEERRLSSHQHRRLRFLG